MIKALYNNLNKYSLSIGKRKENKYKKNFMGMLISYTWLIAFP